MKKNLLLQLSLMFLSVSLFGVTINDIELIPKIILAPSGYSGDIAYHPNDGSLHCIWVNQGRLNYQVLSADRQWNTVKIISPPEHDVYANEFSGTVEWIRFCAGITIDLDGGIYIVYSTRNGGVYYMTQTEDEWSEPILVYQADLAMCHPEIAVLNGNISIIFEDASRPDYKPVYEIRCIDGVWDSVPRLIFYADNPDLVSGENGMFYIAARSFDNVDWDHNVLFGTVIPGFSDWDLNQVTHTETHGIGKAPALWVHDQQIFMAWSCRLGDLAEDRDDKGPMYCATAQEPGSDWDLYMSLTNDPIYSVATGDPYPRVAAYSDGTVFFTNGKKGWATHADKFANVYSRSQWTGYLKCDWEDGIPHLASDGEVVWCLVSTSGEANQEVSLTGFKNLFAEPFDYLNKRPLITQMPKKRWLINHTSASRCIAEDADLDSIQFELLQAPSGITLSQQSGEISWTPQSSVSFLVGIKVRDNRGKYDVRYQWFYATNQLITAAFYSENREGQLPYCVQFSNTTTGNADSVRWEFGDGHISTEYQPEHCYIDPGVFDVRLTVFCDGQSDSRFQFDYVTVHPPELKAGFTVSSVQGAAPFQVLFTDTTEGQPQQWLWNFGDGNESAERDPIHIYQTPGTYTVTLTVNDPYQQKTVQKQDVIVVDYPAPVAAFTVADTVGYTPFEVHFTDYSVGSITEWFWDFSDGNNNTQNPVHVFQNTGIYSITLSVSGPGGNDELIKTAYIHALPVEPIQIDFTADTLEGIAPLTIQFQDLSAGTILEHEWYFGEEGGVSILQNPQYTYQTPGHFAVMLTATGPDTSVSLVKYQYILVNSSSTVSGQKNIPLQYCLHPNHPNPFNMQTTFQFDLPDLADVRLTIFDLRGQRILRLSEGIMPAGTHQVAWNGMTESGQEAPSGIYLAMFEAGSYRAQRKVMLVK